MKNVTRILWVLLAFLSPLILSCSDGNNNDNSVYDLRPLSGVFEDFGSPTMNQTVPTSHWKSRRYVFDRSEGDPVPGPRVASPQESANIEGTCTYEYGDNAHLYWTKAICKDDLGNILLTTDQTLDGDGFPVRRIGYDGKGIFADAYDYTYDKSLYLMNSYIHYREDPADNPDAAKSYEYSDRWDEYGIFLTQTAVSYDLTGMKVYEEKVRSVVRNNVLRGCRGIVYPEYYREYDGGELTYQEKGTFDPDGYPKSLDVDSNGDGTYDQTYHFETEKTTEGYLESVVMTEDDTGAKIWKEMYVYDGNGLLKTWKWWYGVSDDQFELSAIYTFVWYENPVNGPTGGEYVDFQSDENGKPLSSYRTMDWTERQKVYHYYSSPEKESRRDLYNLEKIKL